MTISSPVPAYLLFSMPHAFLIETVGYFFRFKIYLQQLE